MHDPLQRLYRTKLALLASLLTFTGLGLLIFGHWIQHVSTWRWLTNWPIVDIGSGLFTTGLLGVALQYFDGQDSEVRATQRLERVLTAATPAMRDAVIDGFAFQPDDLARVATTATLDKIITNALAIRLGDAAFATDVYDDIQAQAIDVPERLHDARISIRLSPPPMGGGTTFGRAALFVATIRWEYSLVASFQTRRFACVSDIREFREVSQDTVANSAWYVGPRTGLDAGAKETFELVEYTVNGESRAIRRTEKAGSQTYSINLGVETMREGESIDVAYTYRTLIAADEHLLQLRVDQPTEGLTVEVDYGETGIDFLSVLDFISSSETARIGRSPTSVPSKSVTIDIDGWVFPRSGVAFAWATPFKTQ